MSYYTKHVFVCTNQKPSGKVCCANSGGELLFDYLKSQLIERGLHGEGQIRVSKSGCLGRCGLGPCIVIYPEGVWYACASPSDIDELISQHMVLGKVVEHLLIN